MLKRYLKLSIVALIQLLPLAIVITVLASLLANNPGIFSRWQHFFETFKIAFLLGHAFFYLALFGLWPKLVVLVVLRMPEKPDQPRIAKAIQLRSYLIGVFLVLELLHYVGV